MTNIKIPTSTPDQPTHEQETPLPENQDFPSHLAQSYSSLSPMARRIADYLQQYPLAAVTLSVGQIAEKVDTSKASVSRFFKQLGYSSHQQVRESILRQRDDGVPIAHPSSAKTRLDQEIANVSKTLNSINSESILRIAKQLVDAPRVIVFGGRSSYPLAISLRQQLKQIRSDVELIPKPGQTLAEDIIDISAQDVVVVFGFRRRPKVFESLLRSLQTDQTILITDPTGQLYNNEVSELLVCQLGHDQAFDSYASPMAVVSLLCNQAYQLIGNDGQNRTQGISNLYKELDELS